jgi:hypothetical protein
MINNIYIFYHILITDDVKSINIVAEQLNNLMISNLLSVTKKIFIGIIYGGKNKTVLDGLTDLIQSYNINDNITIMFNHKNGSEDLTLTQLKNFTKTLSDDHNYFLYFHTKGVTHLEDNFFMPTKYWRHYLNYFNIIKWKDAVNKLDEGYDSCGVLWISDKEHPNLSISTWENRGFYAGTFFWLSKSLIDKIPDTFFTNNCRLGRHCVEALPSIVPHNFYILDNVPIDFNIDMYQIVYNPSMYQH